MERRRPTDWELSTVPLEGRGSGKEKMKLAQQAGEDPAGSILLLHRGPEVRSRQHPGQVAVYTEGLRTGRLSGGGKVRSEPWPKHPVCTQTA